MTWLARSWQDMSPALRRYYRVSVPPCLLFLALACTHEWVSRQAGLALPLRAAAAIAPVLALAWLFAVYLRFLRDCDELERRIELGALAWAAGITLHAVLACLFLLDARVIDWPAQRAVGVLGLVLTSSYALVRAWLHRRYA